jgi:hypothetical protein
MRDDIARGMVTALGGTSEELPQIELSGEATLPSAFAVTDLATGAVSPAAAAIAKHRD